MNSPTLLRTLRHTSICRFFSTKPAFTCDRYKMKRGPYANISNDHVAFFNELLGRNRVITDAEECEGYNIDYSKIVRGKRKQRSSSIIRTVLYTFLRILNRIYVFVRSAKVSLCRNDVLCIVANKFCSVLLANRRV